MTAFGFGPSLALRQRRIAAVFDFAGAALPAGAALTRGSVATRVSASGVSVSEANDVARFDYDPVALGYRGLLIEGAATNLVKYSRDLTQGWTKTGSAPSVTALIETAAASAHSVVQMVTLTAGQTVTMSAVAAEITGSAKRYLTLFGSTAGFGVNNAATFDLAAGTTTVSGAVIVAAGVIAAGGGAWLCWVAMTPTASVTTNMTARLSTTALVGGGSSYTGDGASGVALTDVQIESGAAPTSRIVTSTAIATRSADALVLTWGGRGVADGAVTVRYTFDDASTQDVATTIAGGSATVPTGLARPRLLRAAIV